MQRFAGVSPSIVELERAIRQGGGMRTVGAHLDFIVDGRSLRSALRNPDLTTPFG